MSLLTELKRRNVFRVAIAYGVIAWVLAQVADLAFDNFGTPDWVGKTVLFLLVLGFPLAVFFAWAFEMTPEGIKKDKDVDRSQSITPQTGRKLNHLTIGVLVIAVGWLLTDKLVLQEGASVEVEQTAVADKTNGSVAVLPFVAMSSGPDDEYFADGLTEEILNSLARLPELLVTARTSSFAFKGLDTSIIEIANKLGVEHVIEGSVRRSGEQLRITAQLIRARDGFHLWSETYDRSSGDSFGVQGDAAEARELRDRLIQQAGTGLFSIAQHAILGEQSQANQLAAAWDARPLGYLELLDQISSCTCGAPFDLEVTPNFARLIDEAKLPWPPPAPINWPLKDW